MEYISGQKQFYTVDELSGILGLHPKTVTRFVREGRIRGRKIGRTWKVHHDDLRTYAHAELRPDESLTPVRTDRPGTIADRLRVSAVVELLERDADESSRISNALIAMLNCKDPAWGPARYDMQHDPPAGKTRFVLSGSPGFIREVMVFIGHLTGEVNS